MSRPELGELPPARRRKRGKAGYLVALIALLGVVGAMLYGNLSKSLVYFVTPTEYRSALAQYQGKTLRLGGLVQGEQYDPQTQLLRFTITDGSVHYPVQYQGAVPELFKANQGVVVEGRFTGDTFQARSLLVKHSEEYRAPDGPVDQADLKKLLQDTR
ncbi:cytochrome c maturation protein CcmE [Deinococcus peraridilitoris]|uniref:Cytochrome c-type biogenesis protein CcmE n=1 Tax=Deinococcus peraridilitoris (strain DSM 19664 / LMG 22246 / CIP 109416 / KR-200) TaxID=937777 RepID=K9ZYU3_DEIPD|nr:cytochrome c maturation protein CcmE [Deinococcus peraridilitoris]AFZ66374.1 cytochrome c-type biogenesis protein CcmE [Deinococcus peraridilitoris DSM 19664]